MTELSPGDFLYQSDQELFLVVIDEEEDHYSLAVHGWRKIGKDRIDNYIEDDRSKVHKQSEIESLIKEKGNESTEKQFNRLKQLFSVYENANIPDDGPQTNFTLDET